MKAQKEALEASQREQMKLMQEGRDREAARMNQVVTDMKNQMQTQLKNQQENERKTREHYDKLIKEISNRPPVVVESEKPKCFVYFSPYMPITYFRRWQLPTWILSYQNGRWIRKTN